MPFQHPLRVIFFRTGVGNEPVREWLKDLPKEERTLVGEDIKTVQFRWPLGMPLVRHLDEKIYEVRSNLPTRIARTLFFVHGETHHPASRIRQKDQANTRRGPCHGQAKKTRLPKHP